VRRSFTKRRFTRSVLVSHRPRPRLRRLGRSAGTRAPDGSCRCGSPAADHGLVWGSTFFSRASRVIYLASLAGFLLARGHLNPVFLEKPVSQIYAHVSSATNTRVSKASGIPMPAFLYLLSYFSFLFSRTHTCFS
jgi:hypothetical protein